jgi:hypothetical protein
MKIEQVYEDIKRLDESEFIESLNYQGINLWPLVRYHLLLKFKDGKIYLESTPKILSNNLTWWQKLKLKRHVLSQRKKFELGSSDILFLDELRYNTDTVEGKMFNRHAQPYLELAKDFSNAKLFTVDEKLQEKTDSIYVNPWYFILSQSKIEMFDTKILEKYNVIINQKSFVQQAVMIIFWKDYFLNLFKNIRPKIIFIPCFYDPIGFGLIEACKKYGIITIDVQHGNQGKFHPIYYGWNYFPNEGYSLMPDCFWVWGEYFKKTLLKGATNEKFPKIIVGGNAWLMREKESKFDFNPIPQKYLRPNTKTILFALQPVETDYTVDFIRKMAKFDPEINIILRFHPIMHKDKLIYERELNKFTNIDFDTGNNFKLFELFRFCQLVASLWSTVVLEGIEFGLTSYLIHPNGRAVFNDDIESGLLFYFDQPNELIKHFQNQPTKTRGVINTNREIILNSLKEICK